MMLIGVFLACIVSISSGDLFNKVHRTFFVSIKIFAKYSPISLSEISCTPDGKNNGITVDAQPGSAVLLNSLTHRAQNPIPILPMDTNKPSVVMARRSDKDGE